MELSPIYDITPHTLLDYEGKIASIIWFAGCPLRCVYCHNFHIIKASGNIKIKDALEFLEARKSWNDAVVLSGGECCMYDGILDFCKSIKEMGFLVKVDTSGVRPKTALELAESGCVDKISLDFKAPKELFETVTGANAYNLFEKTLKGLIGIGINFDVRTTVHKHYIDEQAVSKMANMLYDMGYKGTYTVQKARTDCGTFGHLKESKGRFVCSIVDSKIPISFIGF